MGKRLNELKKLKSRRNKYEHLYHQCTPLGDYKTMLWLPLDIEEKLKMFFIQKDPLQAELMIILILREYEDGGTKISHIEDRMVSNLSFDYLVLYRQTFLGI